MKSIFLQINTKDNVLVALQDLQKGSLIQFENFNIELQEDIPAKHKFYLNDMQAGDAVIMYGVLVGKIQYTGGQNSISHCCRYQNEYRKLKTCIVAFWL